MEVEKPFKCSVCQQRFTNEDHLQVHKKRHEMSLDLSGKSSGNGGASAIDNFVDETPTPSRFIRGCEEVGLFQDLHNPFDEQFTKAASGSGTPTGDAYEFNFYSSKKTDDTLNTPRPHFGFSTSTLKSSPPNTEKSMKDSSVGVATKSGKSNATLVVPKLSASTAEESEVESITPDREGFAADLFAEKQSRESKKALDDSNELSLRLMSESQESDEDDTDPLLQVDLFDGGETKSGRKRRRVGGEGTKKVELLERNRAAAQRSRERKKNWMYNLEARCQTLQTLLSQSQAESNRLRQENITLKDELAKHAHCEVSRAEIRPRILTPKTPVPDLQPHIFRIATSTTSRPTPILPASITPTASAQLAASKANVVSMPILSVVKPKRGRPRKGQEKRLPLVSAEPVLMTAVTILPAPVIAIRTVESADTSMKDLGKNITSKKDPSKEKAKPESSGLPSTSIAYVIGSNIIAM